MRLLSLDAETYYDNDYSLSKMTTEAYVRDPRFELIGMSVSIDGKPPVWLEEWQWRAFAAQVDWPSVTCSAHHAHFDGLILSHHYGAYPGRWLDTLGMSRAIHGSRIGNSLEALLVHYGLKPKGDYVQSAKGKRRADFTPEEFAEYGAYSNNDNVGHQQLLKIFLPQFNRDELDIQDMTVRWFTEPVLVCNEEVLAQALVNELTRRRDLLTACGLDEKALGSDERLAEAFRHIGIEPPRKVTPKGNEKYAFSKTDPDFQAILEGPDEDGRILAEARLAVKSTLNLSRTKRFINLAKGGRACPVYIKYAAAHTWRWGGGDSMNWQNLERTNKKNPKKGMIRKAIEAPAGHLLAVGDQAQVEARKTAWLAGHQQLLYDFADGKDVYSLFASKCYGRTIDRKNNPDDEIPGHVGKTCVLGLGFGMAWYKFSMEMLKGAQGGPPVQFKVDDLEKMEIDPSRFLSNPKNIERIREMPSRLELKDRLIHCAVSSHIVNIYRRENAPIVKLWEFCDMVIERMYRKQYGPVFYLGVIEIVEDGLRLPNGMLLRYPHIMKDEHGNYSYLSGKNRRTKLYGGLLTENVVQALCRVIIADNMLRLDREYHRGIMGRRSRIAWSTHDEIVNVVPEPAAHECFAAMMQIMKTPPAWAPGLPLKAEGGVGRVYGEIK